MSRREFSIRIKVAAFQRAQGRCEACQTMLKPGGYHVDHIRADGLLGEPTLDNAAVLCHGCHTVKTANDVDMIARAKRREAAAIGARQSKTPLPFGRKSKFKKRMDGSIVLRGPLN